jgi:hypothetical protein
LGPSSGAPGKHQHRLFFAFGKSRSLKGKIREVGTSVRPNVVLYCNECGSLFGVNWTIKYHHPIDASTFELIAHN